jgi:hypothetical protein
LNVGAGSPGFLLIIINLNKPAQPHNRNQYQPGFINVKFWWGGAGLSRLFVRFERFCRTRPYGFYFNDLPELVAISAIIINNHTRSLEINYCNEK